MRNILTTGHEFFIGISPHVGGSPEGGHGGIQLLLADVAPRSGKVAEDRDGNMFPDIGR
jgi:hypothetical protein